MKRSYLLLILVIVLFVSTSVVCTPGIQYRDVELINLSNDTIYEAYDCKSRDVEGYFNIEYILESQRQDILDTLMPNRSVRIEIPSWDHDASKEDNRNWLNNMEYRIFI